MAKNPDRKIFNKDAFKNCETGESAAPILPQDILNNGRPANLASDGLAGTSPPAPFITFNAARNEKIISNSNAYIVLGQDRPSTEVSGEGGKGAISDTIDLVVGRMASSHGGAGPCDGMFVGNSPAADAARIYISRSTRVDKNFGIVQTPWEEQFNKDGVEPQRSAIAVKADKVRIIGRAGVKIVTGGMAGVTGYGFKGETDSFGNKLEIVPTIDLIAGNEIGRKRYLSLSGKEETYLQPIALGYRTRDALAKMAELVDHLMGLMIQSEMLTSTCFSAMGAALSPLSAATGADATARMNFCSSPLYTLRQSMTEFEGLYLTAQAPRAVWSRNVNST